jgi:hypothetical protein
MKNALKNFLLWQKKRNELPVINNPQADWDEMQSLLNEHMPVVKKPGGFKGFRTFPAILITFSAAAMIYVAGNIYSLEKHNHAAKNHFHKGNPLRPAPHFAGSPDSLSSTADTGNILPGRTDAADHSSKHPTVNDHNNPSTQRAQAGDTKNTELTIDNRPGHNLSSVNRQSKLSSAAQQSGHLVKSLIANNKTGFSRGESSHYHRDHVPSGPGNSNHNQTTSGNRPGSNHVNNNNPGKITAALNSFINRPQAETLFLALQPALRFDLGLSKIQRSTLPVLNSRLNQTRLQAGNQTKGNKGKPDKPQNSNPSNIDWGLLMGVNTSGSFTPKSQNTNFYGSASIDPWFGLFVSYKINTNWAIAPQVRLFSPQTIITSYTHANQSMVDSGQSLTITAARKMYAVSVPIYVVYNTGSGLHFKAGPVINFPIKQIHTGSVLLPYSIRTDTSYYKNISTILNATQYQQNINFGFSAGASYQFKRFIFEATYLKSLSGYGISSGLGAYKSYNGTFQFTIGFQLDKVKP